MKLPDDMLPEEQDPQYEELITLLRHVNLNPMLIDPAEHAQIVLQARARLFPTDSEVSKPEMQELGSLPSKPKARADKQHRGRRLLHTLNMLAAALVVAALLGSALLLFGPRQQSTLVATRKMIVTRIDNGPLLPGQSIRLHGQGFSPHGHISFLFDGTEQLFDQNGNSNSTQANAQGVFSTTVVLNSNLPWHPGIHFINAQDLTTKRMAKL